ncbi:MAG: aminopeptidase P family protein [Christensenella sp.]|uniref:M24 family metallopeptidase n=1 Tax=Christensenella sp. TaxID=1935934 RepID=UPI002B1FBB74|nr:aminopeptidase P family protein [Christensenella sp.]MEA5004599.1 aminopeptidase P family protein [Christensenella sp.]
MTIAQKIRALDKAEAYLLTSVENVAYTTGFSGDSSQVLITSEEVLFFTDSRFVEMARNEVGNRAEVICTGGQDRLPSISKYLRENQKLGIEQGNVTVKEFQEFERELGSREYVDISEDMLLERMVKTEEELEKIRIAARASEVALTGLLPYIRPGVSELDIRAELEYRMKKQGMDLAFPTIVAGGLNSAIPHATPSAYRIKNGDLLTLDFGCRFEGYCSDITRTFGIGNIDGESKKIYDIVNEAQKRAAGRAQVGADTYYVDEAARSYIAENGYGEYYDHGTGHGVGRQIHELPVLNPRSSTILQENMVFTVEPGIYVPGLGGVRIEDTLITGQGSVYEFSKELILL